MLAVTNLPYEGVRSIGFDIQFTKLGSELHTQFSHTVLGVFLKYLRKFECQVGWYRKWKLHYFREIRMVNGDVYKILEIKFARAIQLAFNYDTVNGEC